ncbi:hypothetical protein O0L34_g15337 [Tuta absoluta]|nr:hypothetical protein O0L34_g15337 [Tuta absoluta]
MARYKCRGIRGRWTEDDMIKAMSAVKRGVMKVYTASKHFNIPRRTLKRYLTENKNEKSSLGRKPLLSKEQEKDLEARIKRFCNIGSPLTPRVLRSCVKTFCYKNNIPVSRNGVMIGRDWLRGFLKRHRGLSLRKAQNLNPARAQKMNKVVVGDYFNKLRKVLEDNGLLNSPERIFNIDEKGCQLNLHKTPQVLAERGTKRVHMVGHEHAENVTVVSCGNALGQAIPPMILFKGKRMKPEWKDALPNGSNVQMTPKGSMNIAVFVEWIHHLAKYKLPGPCVVIFDGAKCHLDYSIVEAADKFDIKLLCLPSNTTHELQPMDKSVFRSFEYFWDEEVLKYWGHHEDRRITKQRFGVIFSKVWDKAMTPANIKAGFEATGIYPFDPTRIPDEAYAPSLPTHVPIPEGSVNNATQESWDDEDDINLAAFASTASCSIGSADKTRRSSVLTHEAQCPTPCSSKDMTNENPISSEFEMSSVDNRPITCASKDTRSEMTLEDQCPIPCCSKDTTHKNPILGRPEVSLEDKIDQERAGFPETVSSNNKTGSTDLPSSENITKGSTSVKDSGITFEDSAPLRATDSTPVKDSNMAIEASSPLATKNSTPPMDLDVALKDTVLLTAKNITSFKYSDMTFKDLVPLAAKDSTPIKDSDMAFETLYPLTTKKTTPAMDLDEAFENTVLVAAKNSTPVKDSDMTFKDSVPMAAKDSTPIKDSDMAIETLYPLTTKKTTPAMDLDEAFENTVLVAAKNSTPVKDSDMTFKDSVPMAAKNSTPVKDSDMAIEALYPLAKKKSTPAMDLGVAFEDTVPVAAKNSTTDTDFDMVFKASAPLATKYSASNCNNRAIENLEPIPSTSSDTYVSFKTMLKTPQKNSSPTVVTRKKAINCLAQVLTKDIFNNKENTTKITAKKKATKKNKTQDKNTNKKELKKEKTVKGKGKGKTTKKTPSSESWYCFVCQEDKIADMRLCLICASYVHEECVGLTAIDKEQFVCIRCEDK